MVRVLLSLTLLVSVGIWIIWLPGIAYSILPAHLVASLETGSSTSVLLLLFLGLPLIFGILGVNALLCWALVARLFSKRKDIDSFIHSSIVGGHEGRIQKAILDRIFGP